MGHFTFVQCDKKVILRVAKNLTKFCLPKTKPFAKIKQRA